MKSSLLPFLALCLWLSACHNGDQPSSKNPGKDSTAAKDKKPAVKKDDRKPPIINITDSLQLKRIVICMKDSAASQERISMKLGQLYGVKLPEIIKKEKLKVTGQPLAWYHSSKAPFFFDAGIPVNTRPAKLPGNMFIRETKADSAVIAHFFGPYDMMAKGYEAVREWMKDNKKMPGGEPYEIYITDPIDKNGKPVDPYRVQTDIVFPVKRQ